MVEKDKIYIINTMDSHGNDLTKVKCFSVRETVATEIADYFLGRKVHIFLLCRQGYSSIFLKSYIHGEMVEEINKWLTSIVQVRYKNIGNMKSVPFPLNREE